MQGGALTYNDAWVQFREFAKQSNSYTGAYTLLSSWLGRLGVNQTERANVIKFMQDSMITSSTNVTDPLGNFNCPGFNKVVYPVYNQFVLEDMDNPPATIKILLSIY